MFRRLIAVVVVVGSVHVSCAASTAQNVASTMGKSGVPVKSEGEASRSGPELTILETDVRSITIEMRANWRESFSEVMDRSTTVYELLTNATQSTPEVSKWVELNGRESARVEVLSADYDEAPFPSGLDRDRLEEPLAELVGMGTFRKQFGASLVIRPLRLVGGSLRRYRRVVVRVYRGQEAPQLRQEGTGFVNPHLEVNESVLAFGRWFRLKVREDGVYRVDRGVLEELGINPEATDPASLQIYGNGGAPLPAANDEPRPADLIENATFVVGGGDGSFDAGDGLYFYGQGPITWFWNADSSSSDPGWRHRLNVFTDHAAYFLRVGGQNHQRVGQTGYPGWGDATVIPRIEDRLVVEEDRMNWEHLNSGSGLDWLGDDIVRSSQLTLLDTIPPGFSGGTIRYRTRVGTRSNPAASVVLSVGGQTAHTMTPGTVNPSTSTGYAVRTETEEFEVTNVTSPAVSYVMTGGDANALAWIDYVEAYLQRPPRARGGTLRFSTPGGRAGRFEYSLRGFDQRPRVWDVTDLSSIQPVGVQPDGNNFRIQVEVEDATRPREILAFVPGGQGVRSPTPDGRVEQQNLHGISFFPDYVVVSADTLLTQAQRLADYRKQNDGLTPLVVTTTQVFNEFGNGVSDMRAIRDFMKFLYDRAPEEQLPRWLLLFGDGHYDFRGIEGEGPPLVPTYQTDESFRLVESYTSDDYFGLLDDDEGEWRWPGSSSGTSSERVDVGIGRIPANSPDSARAFVDKIFQYESEEAGGVWRSEVVFTADDQYPNSWDTDIHLKNAEDVLQDIVEDHPELTIQKIYEHSFPLVTTAEGRRRPGATEALRRAFDEGVLLVNYNGHGGPEGLSGEKLVTREFGASLTNTRYPILMTASCSVGKYDANGWQSLAEDMLMKPDGGNIAVFTTVRVVYTSASDDSYIVGINRATVDSLMKRDSEGMPRRLGTATMLAKQTSAGVQGNNRKFNLLGDPAMRIGLPVQPARITSINGVDVPADSASMPVFRAFEVAQIEGEVLTNNGGRRDAGFNGEVTVTVYDSERSVVIPNDPPGTVNHTDGTYDVRTGKLFTGRASVQNGRFGIEFLVPQDVSYSGEDARVSVVGKSGNGRRDAIGVSTSAFVAEDAGTRPDDSEGPVVRLFLDDTTFVSGGLVRPEATLIAKLSDQSGINTVGAGVGHEMLLEIDNNAAEAVDISSFYQGDLDTFRSGEARYALPSLSPGEHTLRLTVWDGVNNSTTGELAFVVGEADELIVQNAYPYPNPTTGATRFVFEHNQAPGTAASVQLRIYTIAGRPVRTIHSEDALPGGILPGPLVDIPWDGRDDDGDRLASGIYLYKLRVATDGLDGDRSVSEVIERLAIIR